MNRRVLITGVSRQWGAALAARLEADPDVDEIIAVDTEPPARQLARTEFIQADIRHSMVGRLVRALGIDTVVHAGTIIDTRNVSPRRVHETNVIGTMNLLAACSGADSPVRTVVVKSSTAIYGAAPDAPSFWAEDMRHRATDGFARGLGEMEAYVSDFAARCPETTVTVLRFATVLGNSDQTPFAAYLGMAVVPTVLGFDPRLQFVHEDDVVDCLQHAVHTPTPGTFNVAGDGAVVLSQAISMMGQTNLPIIPFVATGLAADLMRSAGLLHLPAHLVDLIQHGRVVDTKRLREGFGVKLAHTSRQCVAEHARWRRQLGREREPRHSEADIEAFLHSRAGAAPAGSTTR